MTSQAANDTASVRATIDIVVGVLLVFVGISGVASGTMITALAERDVIADLVEAGVIESDVLTDAELIELVYGAILWGGIGIALAGGLLIAAAMLFAIVRVRGHRQAIPPRSLFADAVVGAVVTLLTSFVPFSSVIGGAVAGYLYRDGPWQGVRVGLLVGLLVAVPILVVTGTVAAGYVDLDLLWASLILVVFGVFSAGVTIVFAAIGGYVGGYLHADRKD